MRGFDGQRLTIGVLYPGEMGAAMARELGAAGHRVVTTLAERSSRTRGLAEEAGIEELIDLQGVVAVSDLIISLVSPAAALSIARQVASCRQRPDEAIYVDANSISPMTAAQIGQVLDSHGIRFVDAAIHGPAGRLAELGAVYLSGPDAAWVGGVFDGLVDVELLGDEPGRASAMKMLLGGMVKGLVALFLEMSLAGRNAGLLDEFVARITDTYPGIMRLITRTLPTYPRHAARRAEELSELEATLRGLDISPQMAAAARRSTADLAESNLHEYAQAVEDGLFDLDDLIELIALHSPLGGREPSPTFHVARCHV